MSIKTTHRLATPLHLAAVLALTAPLSWFSSAMAQEAVPEGLPDTAEEATLLTGPEEGAVADLSETPERAGFSIALNKLRAQSGNIELRQSRSRDSIYYAIAPQMKVDSVALHLEYINSISLIGGRSQLRVVNNGNVVAQFRLDPNQPNVIANIVIGAETIKSGYNQLAFEVAQHYTEECEDFSAPELWTQINTQKSTLTVDGAIDLQNPKLSALNDLISPFMGGARDFRIVSAASEMTNDSLSWGGLLAQALSQRLDYVSPNLSFEMARASAAQDEAPTGPQNFPGLDLTLLDGDNLVLFGTLDALRPYVSEEIAGKVTSAFVGTFALDGNPDQFAIVISGTTNEEVDRAALAFSLESFPFIDDATMLIGAVDIPFAAAQGTSSLLEPDNVYRFDRLNFQSSTLSSVGEQSAVLNFDLPADYYVKESANVGLNLDFSYGAGFRGDSVLNLYLNGVFQRAIGLNAEDGASFRDYRLYLPARMFIPGRNTILFRPAFFSPYGGPCISPGRENLILTLSGSSEISIPDGERYVHQPSLSIFRRTGFPYTKDVTGEDLAILVTDKSEDSIAAALTILAKISQTSGASMHKLWVGFDLPDEKKERHLIVTGQVSDLPDAILEGAPLALKGDMALPYPARSGVVANAAQQDFWTDFNAAYKAMRGSKDAPAQKHVTMQQTGGLGSNSILVAYENPYAESKTVTLVTAASSEILLENVQALTKDDMWSQLAGDLAVWRGGSKFVWTQRAGKLFQVGSIDFFELMRYHLARAPWWWIVGFFLIIPIFSFLVRALLKERQRLKETV
jgi:cellulose synthase operon protein B